MRRTSTALGTLTAFLLMSSATFAQIGESGSAGGSVGAGGAVDAGSGSASGNVGGSVGTTTGGSIGTSGASAGTSASGSAGGTLDVDSVSRDDPFGDLLIDESTVFSSGSMTDSDRAELRERCEIITAHRDGYESSTVAWCEANLEAIRG